MTSIEWLIDYMQKMQYFIGNDLLEAFEKAKEMHKKEIIDAAERWKGTDFAERYYQETFVSKGSDDTYKLWECCGMEECICKHPSVISENGNELLFDKEGNLIKELPKQETLYTEEQTLEFAKWLASNWIPFYVEQEYLWEYDELDLSKIPQDYRGYKTEKQLFDIFQSLKQHKKD
jgi:hypothetical protein